MNTVQFYRATAKGLLVLILTLIGLLNHRVLWTDPALYREGELLPQVAWVSFWSGLVLLTLVLAFGNLARYLLSLLRFQARIRRRLPGLGLERNLLLRAAVAIHRGQGERAIAILDELQEGSPGGVAETARWLIALAGSRFLKRNHRLLSSYREKYPQVHGLLFSHGRVPLRRNMLEQELKELQSGELDVLALRFVGLVDEMIACLGRPADPFYLQAEETLEYLTGRTYLLGVQKRFEAWWKGLRPILLRGGGALLAGVRLVQREYYGEATTLLRRLRNDGLLSEETETVFRMTQFFAMAGRSQWRLTSDELPSFFREACYHGALEMGVLRFPTAELPEVVEGCRRARDLREAKLSFIEDSLRLWGVFGEELAIPVSVLLKRLLNHKGRQCPARLGFWQRVWAREREGFEEAVIQTMDGVAAAAEGALDKADQAFQRAVVLQPAQSTAYVNRVYVRLSQDREEEARRLAREIEERFADDGGALVSLGRLFATQLEDTRAAELLFLKARELDRSTTEPLICLGEVKLMEGKYSESQAYFDHAKELDPGLAEARLGLARTYMETKRYKLAIDNLLYVAKEGKGDALHFAHYLLYRAYRDLGEHRNAIEYLERVPTPFFKEPELLDDIAFHLESERHYAMARVFSERAMLLRAQNFERGEDLEALSEH